MNENSKRIRLKNKGSIRLGNDADLALIQPHAPYVLKAKDLAYRNRFSLYVGQEIGCQVVGTFLRRYEIYSKEKGVQKEFLGKFILHPKLKK